GILDHRRKIGSAIWVFLWCLDRVTREESGSGFVLGGKVITAGQIAQEIDDCKRTVRRHLLSLAKSGYLMLQRVSYGFIITVNKSKKFGIWRADKNVHSAEYSDRTILTARSDNSGPQNTNFV